MPRLHDRLRELLLGGRTNLRGGAAPGARHLPVTHDLRTCRDLTFTLLDDFSSWRERLVEEILIEDGDHVTVTSSYQIRLPIDLIRRFRTEVDEGDSVQLLLPLTTRPKDLLLGVELRGPLGVDCTLLMKAQIAWLQREYVHTLLGPELGGEGLDELLYAIANYNDDVWTTFASDDEERSLARYLDDGLPFEVHPSDVARWTPLIAQTQGLLREALGEPDDHRSATEHLLRSLPFTEHAPISPTQTESWLVDFADTVAESDSTARSVIAEYGRRWEVIVETIVPVKTPCTVTITTKRPWGSDRPHRTTQRVSVGDASTCHIEVRIADHSVEIDGEPQLSDLFGQPIGIPVVDSLRYTADTLAIYVANAAETPFFIELSVKLRLRRAIRVLLATIWTMVVAAIMTTILLPEGDQLADQIALLIFPLTLAGAIVLTRETTAVSQRLQERQRVGLAIAIAGLWLLGAFRLLVFDSDVSWLWHTAVEISDTVHETVS